MNSIDIDTGGTFTDGVLHFDGNVVTVKVDTTPHDPVRCFVDCIEAGAKLLGKDTAALLKATEVIRYSTTAATNAIIQRKGAKIGLLVTEGAEENFYSGENGCAAVGIFLDKALVKGVQEEVDANGIVKVKVDADSFRAATEELLDNGARLLVVAFRHATFNPANELRAKSFFRSWFPPYYLGTPFLLLSHQISPRGTDAERLNSAVLSGYLHRGLVGYLYRCDDAVRSQGFRRPLLVVHSTGGLARVAKTKALNTYNSGPTAGVLGAARIARRYGFNRVITMDMGGTSTDVAFIENGNVHFSFRAEIDGVRVSLPMIEVFSVGGGGGSIASVQDGKLLVGPESAGSVPGPACYDLGSTSPTVTDADVVLGLIAPDNFLGGRRRIDAELARRAIEQAVASPLKLGVDEGALRIRSVVAENLAATIRVEASKHSFLLRDAVLFAYGGAGPAHAADIATAAGVPIFYVFPNSPVFSAAGSATMNIEHYYESRVRPHAEESFSQAAGRVIREAIARARRDVRGEGFDPSEARLRCVLETLEGEEHKFDPEAGLETKELANLKDGLVRLTATLETVGSDGGSVSPPPPENSKSITAEREVTWQSGRKQTHVYSFDGVGIGKRILGPAVLETGEMSCVIPEGWIAEKDDCGALVVRRTGEQGGLEANH